MTKPMIKEIYWYHALFLVVVFFAATGAEASWEIHPSITASEEFTDNVYESRFFIKSDYITRVQPGIAINYEAPIGTLDVEYNYDYRYYLRQSREDDDTHRLRARAHLSLIDDIFFLDATDNYQRISLDVSRDLTQESLFVGQTDENAVMASPYFALRLTPKATTSFGYRYTNLWYKSPEAIDRTDHTGFVEAGYEFGENATVKTGYAYTRTERVMGDSNLQDAYLGIEKKYGADLNSFIGAKAGYTTIQYRDNRRYSAPFWNAEFKHQFNYIVTTLGTKVLYGEDPLRSITKETTHSGGLDYLFAKGMIGAMVSYSRFLDTALDRDITKRKSAIIRGRYELRSDLAADILLEASRYDQNESEISTSRVLVGTGSVYYRTLQAGAGLSYNYGENLTFSLLYRYIDYYSPRIVEDNKEINRVILEVRKVF